jgi:Ca2+-binding EF-hand superfamily protein
LGFGHQNKFVLRILSDYEAENITGIDFAEFLKLSTARLHTGSKAEIERVFNSFDINKTVTNILIFRVKYLKLI